MQEKKMEKKYIYIMELWEIIMEYSQDMERDKRKEEISIHYFIIICENNIQLHISIINEMKISMDGIMKHKVRKNISCSIINRILMNNLWK